MRQGKPKAGHDVGRSSSSMSRILLPGGVPTPQAIEGRHSLMYVILVVQLENLTCVTEFPGNTRIKADQTLAPAGL